MTAERPGSDELVAGHIHPALERVQARLEGGGEVETVIEVGDRSRTRPS